MSAKAGFKNIPTKDFIILALLGLLLFLPPYFRGLYFEKEFLYVHMATAVVFLIYLLLNRNEAEIKFSLLDISVLLFVIAYTLSLFAALNIREAVGEILRYINYALIFFMVARIVDTANIRRMLKVLYFSGVGVSVLGLGTAFGLVKTLGGYQYDQIASTLGYSNSLGGYLLPIFILGIYLFIQEANKPIKHLYSTSNYIVLTTFIGTVSRGAFAVFPFTIMLYILLTGKETRTQIIKHLALLFSVVFIFSSRILKTGLPVGRESSLLWLLFGLLLINVLTYALEKYSVGQLIKANRQKLILLTVGVLTVVLGIYFKTNYKLDTVYSNIFPSKVVTKISATDFNDRNVQERFIFYIDALKIVRDYPLIGTGGGGWEAVYTKYQSYLYYTTKVHSHLFQVWVETGILGLVAFGFLWFSLIFTIWRLFKSNISSDDRFLSAAIFASIGAILLHSLLDFDLSLGAIAILLWSLIAILSGYARSYIPTSSDIVNQKWAKNTTRSIAFLSGIALLLISASFTVATSYGQKGSIAVEKWILPEAVKNYEMAFRYDPLKGSYAADLAQSLHYLGDPADNFDMVREAKKYAVAAQKLSPYDTQIKMIKAKIQLSLSEIPEAVKEYEEAREIFPYDQKGYDNLAEVYFKVAQYYTLKGKPQEAKIYFEKTKTVPNMVNDQLRKLSPKYRGFWVAGPMLEVSPAIDKYAKEADKLLSQMR